MQRDSGATRSLNWFQLLLSSFPLPLYLILLSLSFSQAPLPPSVPSRSSPSFVSLTTVGTGRTSPRLHLHPFPFHVSPSVHSRRIRSPGPGSESEGRKALFPPAQWPFILRFIPVTDERGRPAGRPIDGDLSRQRAILRRSFRSFSFDSFVPRRPLLSLQRKAARAARARKEHGAA